MKSNNFRDAGVVIREQSSLMLGRGPEDIFLDTKAFQWPLNIPFDNFNDPSILQL